MNESSHRKRADTIPDRHFLKDELPRIQYINPNMKIEVSRLKKTKEETLKPEMVVQLRASRAASSSSVR